MRKCERNISSLTTWYVQMLILKGFGVEFLLSSGGLLTADAGTAQVKNELKNYTTTNKGRWFLLFRTRMASVLFEKVCKKVV